MKTFSCLLLSLLCLTSAYADEPVDEVQRAFETWLVGKTRAQVIQLLGEPAKTRERDGTTTLIFKSGPDSHAVFPTEMLNPYAFLAEGDERSGGVENWFDMFLDPHAAKKFVGQDHVVQVRERSPIRRIRLRLDSANSVVAVEVDWRKRPKGRVAQPR